MDKLGFVPLSDMTDEEKAAHPEAKATDGYLKKIEASAADRQKWWKELPDNEKRVVTSLPNFDREIFREITGIEVTDD